MVAVGAVIERDRHYLLARYPHAQPENRARWTLPRAASTGTGPVAERALRDGLWNQLGVSVRVRRQLGRFAAHPQQCLVVEAEIVGEPDPDLDQVLELGWHTREQIEELGQSGLLAAGFEPAAIRCACQRRQRRLSLPLRHRLRAHTVVLAAGGVTALAALGLAIGAAGAGLARDCASGSALVSAEQATATGQVLSRCVPLAAVREHLAEVPNALWPPALASVRETGLTEDQSARAALQQIEEQHLSVLHEIVTTGPVAAAITGQDTAALTYLLWPLQSVSSGPVPLGGGVGYIDVFDTDGHDVLVLRHHMRHEDAVQLTDPRAGTWEPVRRVLERSVDEDGGIVPTRWGDTVVYWAAAVKQDGHLVGVVAVGDTLPQIVAQAGAQAQATVTVRWVRRAVGELGTRSGRGGRDATDRIRGRRASCAAPGADGHAHTGPRAILGR